MIKAKGLEIDVGFRFKNITVTELLGYKMRHNYIRYECVCGKCGETSIYLPINNEDYNCGCLNRAKTSIRRKKHGKTKSKEYHTWVRMKMRCYNPNNQDYLQYGGRGITVCESWLTDFEKFLADVGEAPSKQHSLDRVDVNGDYSPENCRWATPQQQSYNQRIYKTNKSGKAGVTWNRKAARWEARISKDGIEHYLGFSQNWMML